MIWLLPLAVYLLAVWGMNQLEKRDRLYWSTFVCLLGGIATAVALLYCIYQSPL